jgi:hypothetical protein
MKASELRIGNWVSNYKDTPTQILEWTGNEAYLTKGRKAYGIKTSSPIPLTEDWLVRFGFEKIEEEEFEIELLSNRISVNISHWTYQIGYSIYWTNEIEIQHVHQLQNLYFALTGEELELK